MHVAGWIGLDPQGRYLEYGGGHHSRQADAHRQASPEPETDAPPGPQANPARAGTIRYAKTRSTPAMRTELPAGDRRVEGARCADHNTGIGRIEEGLT
jgi:hypothetical protein